MSESVTTFFVTERWWISGRVVVMYDWFEAPRHDLAELVELGPRRAWDER